MSGNFLSSEVLSPEMGLKKYLKHIQKFPILTQEEEDFLAKKWYDEGDVQAAHRLVTAHLRLVAKIAFGYRGYGLPLADLIAEGNIGMMQAIKKFDPYKGFRLSTYAMWWIKSAIQEYILRSWSLVKIGTTSAQKKLFFNLKKLKNNLKVFDDRDFSDKKIQHISDELNVSHHDVVDMSNRLSHSDYSLHAPVSTSHQDAGDHKEFQDLLADQNISQEEQMIATETSDTRRMLLQEAIKKLSSREQDILRLRHLAEKPATLEDLSQKYQVSRERIRQIEKRTMEKLQEYMTSDLPQE